MKKSKIFLNLLFVIFFFILLVVLYGNGQQLEQMENVLETLSAISLVLICFIVVSSFSCGIKWNNISFLYICLFYVFTFGQVLCKYVFNFVDKDLFDMSVYVESIYIKQGILLGIYAMLSMYFFTLLFMLFDKSNNKANKKTIEEEVGRNCRASSDELLDLKVIKSIGKMLLIFSCPIAIIELINNINLAISGGYQAVYSDVSYGLESLTSKLVPFFYISLMLMLYANKNNKKHAFKYLIIILVYSSISIFLGARGIPILQFLSVIVLWNYLYPISKRKILLAILLVFPLSAIISLLRVFRSVALSEWITNFFSIFVDSLSSNPFLKAINEMGTAIYPLSATIKIVPTLIPYKYGNTFLYALTTIVPNLSGGSHVSRIAANVNLEVGELLGIAFGGSIVQEFYANFNWWGSILFLGILMYIIIWVEKKCLNSKKNIIIPLFFAMMPNILWTVRNNFAPVFRDFVWYYLSVYLIYIIFKKRCSNEDKCNYSNI